MPNTTGPIAALYKIATHGNAKSTYCLEKLMRCDKDYNTFYAVNRSISIRVCQIT